MSQTKPHTAQDFATAAMTYTQEAEAMRPGAGDDFNHAMQLIVYHLRAAATKAREVSEQLAGRELAAAAAAAAPAIEAPAAEASSLPSCEVSEQLAGVPRRARQIKVGPKEERP